jgi:hypothetical protein
MKSIFVFNFVVVFFLFSSSTIQAQDNHCAECHHCISNCQSSSDRCYTKCLSKFDFINDDALKNCSQQCDTSISCNDKCFCNGCSL